MIQITTESGQMQKTILSLTGLKQNVTEQSLQEMQMAFLRIVITCNSALQNEINRNKQQYQMYFNGKKTRKTFPADHNQAMKSQYQKRFLPTTTGSL